MKRFLIEVDWCSSLIAFFSLIQAIPINQIQDVNRPDFVGGGSTNSTRLENVCVHENAIYSEGQNFTTSNPCETCTCDPPGFSCTLSSCNIKPGCKAMHKANQCCPEYVCECERNGKIYGNGEKVEEPNPCKVCYCKGGEIKCALVTCYTRDDCEPGYVAGVCCPKYDHCPPLEMMKNKSTTPAPAQVIISDLKTDGAVAGKQKKILLLNTESTSSSSSTTETALEVESTLEESSTMATEVEETTMMTTTETSTTPVYDTTTDVTYLEDNTEVMNETTTEENLWENATATDTTLETTTTEDSTTEYQTETTTDSLSTTTSTECETCTDATPTTEEVTRVSSTEETTIASTREDRSEEKSKRNVIKVIVPKTLKKDVEEGSRVVAAPVADGPAPIVVMISAEQIQFLKLAEEPPVYVENRDADVQKREQEHLGVIVVPKTTPTTVEMVKVIGGTLEPEHEPAPSKPVHTNYSLNGTGFIQER